MEHSKIVFTRRYCKMNGIRYQIKGVDDALYIYSNIHKKFIQACYSLLNFETFNDITNMIYKVNKELN